MSPRPPLSYASYVSGFSIDAEPKEFQRSYTKKTTDAENWFTVMCVSPPMFLLNVFQIITTIRKKWFYYIKRDSSELNADGLDAQCSIRTRGSISGAKAEREADHSFPSSVGGSEGVELYIQALVFLRKSNGNFIFCT
jgi:hypothetical protein